MANTELRTFIENRLLALDPSMDVTTGSPAQTEFVEPLLSYLGTDPFDTDIDSFILARLKQEHPGIYANDPSAIRDLFIKPLITILEPLKREILGVSRSQSVIDPTAISDDDADAIGANWFSERAGGSYATGVVRVYYATPTNVPIEISTKFATTSGLNFFPSQPSTMTAEQMVFNRSGSQYYMDVPVRAENAGAEYNVEAGAITSVTGLFGVVRVTNLRATSSGTNIISTEDFIAKTEAALSERSLVTSRGSTARLNDLFQNELVAVQTIGAGDEEMQRDLLVGSSSGHAWLTGKVTLYENLALIQARVVDDDTESPPIPGNKLYAYFPSLAQDIRTVRLNIEEIVGPKISASGEFQCSWLVRWSGTLPAGVALPATVEGGCIREAGIAISSLPGSQATSLKLSSGEAHLFGHTDIYVRPVLRESATAALDIVVDSDALVERTTLESTATQNELVDPITKVGPTITDAFDFLNAGVLPGDILTIESGDAAGTYVIGKVTGNDFPTAPSKLYLTTKITKTGTNWRYRISRHATVDLFEPRIPKLPFASAPSNDLQTTIGSNVFVFTADTLDYGAKVGDTIRVKDLQDEGDFTIIGFTDGQHVLVDRAAKASNSNLPYEIFTALDQVVRPLVRVKEVLLLDSSGKSTGISVPPALPLAVKPTSAFTSAKVLGQSFKKSGVVLPSTSGLVSTNVAATLFAGNDQRYSLGIDDVEGGVYKAMQFDSGAQSEMLFSQDMASCSWFLATVEDASGSENFPPIDEPRPGDALYLKTGPNKGGYLVKRVRKFKYVDGGKALWLYFIQIHGTFRFDVLSSLIKFFDDHGASITKLNGGSATLFPDFFTSFWDALGTNMRTSLINLGVPAPTADILQTAVEDTVACEYEWGTPARGVLRSYFQQPTLFQQNTAESAAPTTYEFLTSGGEVVQFRPTPDLYQSTSIVPAPTGTDPEVADLPRDGTYAGSMMTLGMSDKPSAFAMGITPGDRVEVHEEVLLIPIVDHLQAVQTTQGSNVVVAPIGLPFTEDMVGNFLSLEEGDDAGLYRVTGFQSASTVLLDRPLSTSTPSGLLYGTNTSFGYSSGQNVVQDTSIDFSLLVGVVGKWVTLYGVDTYAGSYLITSVVDANTVAVSRGALANFPAFPVTGARCVVTDAPTTAPNTVGLGTELVGLHPVRMYQDRPFAASVIAVNTDPAVSTLTLSGTPYAGKSQPYRIFRQNIRRISPAQMVSSTEDAFFYFDTDVLSLSPRSEANLAASSYLTIMEGTFYSYGYRHAVRDASYSYSMLEEGNLILPLRVLPENTPDRLDNELNVIGSPIQISYERSDLVARVQEFIENREDRTASANMLARHFLPAYVSYDATYVGGSDPSMVAADIIDYVNNIPIETSLDVSEIQDKIRLRGGNPETPTTVALILHDLERRQWAEFGQNKLGGDFTDVPYSGTPRIAFYVPGADVSTVDSIPYGERIKLTRL